MADSTCHFKREENPKPILPKCRYNLNCTDYTHTHRFGFYHDTFDSNHRERMKFLLTSSKYSLSKKKQDPTFSGKYLWDQFSVDLNDETYHDFLIYTYMYIMHLEKLDYADLMSIKQAFTTLEENGICILTATHLPLIIAYALTIHKSQGATLDCVEIDLSKSFEYGQSYVALSRVKTIEGLYIKDIDYSKIIAHPKAIQFYKKYTTI